MTEIETHATKPKHENKFHSFNLYHPLSIVFAFIFVIYYLNRFKPKLVQDVMHKVIVEKLQGQSYRVEDTSTWSREISDDIRNRMKGILSIHSISAIHFS